MSDYAYRDIIAGAVEPHAAMLTVPDDGQRLYKIMTAENLIRSIADGYLHFNRVDSYRDFTGADEQDSEQLPLDLAGNAGARFEKAPDFSAADYYNQARARTYACCFSLENSANIWSEYGNGSARGKSCVVFEFAKLRSRLNAALQGAVLDVGGHRCTQIFSVDYGIVEYADRKSHRANDPHLPNPIKYAFLKDQRFSDEKELRVSLSALGIGTYQVAGEPMVFEPSLQVTFDHRAAMADGTITKIECAPEADPFIRSELGKLCIHPPV